MPYLTTSFPCFTATAKKDVVPVIILRASEAKSWLKKQNAFVTAQAQNFTGQDKQVCLVTGKNGSLEMVLAGIGDALGPYSLSTAYAKLSGGSYVLEGKLSGDEATLACMGWGYAAYSFDRYKKTKKDKSPALVWPKAADKRRVQAFVEGVTFTRDLINIPANDLGTNELAAAAQELTKKHDAACTIIKGKKIETGFPMIHAVGRASTINPPQLIDIKWGKKSHPKVTLIGKGIIYDTGGLDIKPSPHMKLMKKDMGGSAHVLGLAHIIMSLKLPIQLRVLIPTAENSIAGNAFRPGDIIQSRKGLSVEVGNTDAEGRLVVADATTYACEDKPDLLIDVCTLTGHARVALGYDVPALFSTSLKTADEMRDISMTVNDPVWPLPLWKDYLSEMKSDCADISNDGNGRAGAIHGALFIHEFAEPSIDWVHLDAYAWEQYGKPGRAKGGCDTGLRTLYAWLEKTYSKK